MADKLGGRRYYDEVLERLTEGGWTITSADRYAEVRAETQSLKVVWNPVNGHLTGEHVSGLEFTHQSSELDGHTWYRNLLSNFYYA